MNRPNLLRTWALCAVVASAAFATAQDQPKVSFSQPVMKASAVLQAISQQTGVFLASDPIVGNIPVLVSVTDAPLDQLLERIARAVGGQVRAENGGFRLINNDTLRREQEAKESGWIVAAFDKAKAKMRSNGAAVPDRWDDKTLNDLVAKAEAAQKAISDKVGQIQTQAGSRIQMFDSSMQSATPASGAARRALDAIPSNVLAGVLPGERIVFSSAPNRMQRRIPFNVTPLVNDFVYNHNALAQRAPQLQGNPNVTVVGGLQAGQPIQGISETHVILSRGYRSTTVMVEVKFYDREGLMVGQATSSITPQYDPVVPQISQEGKAIELTELARQFAQLMAQETAQGGRKDMVRMASINGGTASFVTINGGDAGLPKQIPDALLQFMLNPDKSDPASLYVSEAYTQVAKAEGKNLVATFPDKAVRDMARTLVAGNVTTKTVLQNSGAFGMTVEDADGWLVATPTWADATRKTNFNRVEAAKLYRNVDSRGFATLEELADYSFYITLGLPDRPLDMVYLGLLHKDVASTLDEYVSFNLDLLRLYALIPESTKKAGGEVIQLAFRTLTGQAKAAAEHSYYSKPSGFIMPEGGAGAEMKFTAIMAIAADDARNGPPPNSIMNEPTEALPNGIPGEALVSLRRTLQDGVFATTKGVRGGSLLSAEELGMRQGMLQANFNGGGTMPPDFDAYVPAQIVQVEIALELGNYGRPSANFKDGWLVSGARAVGYGQLSEAFRARVDQMKQNMMAPPITRDGSGVRVRGGGGG